MELSYQHANPHQGRESYLLRIHDDLPDQTICILVDAGDGVDVDDLLADDEYLSAILLTHAHLDHYQTLGANLRDNAPIYATPETVETLHTILENSGEQADLAQPDAIQDALEPITEWTSITSETRVHPVPAGHAPGASGFVIQCADDGEYHHLLATGDFTTRRAAGYPGIVTDLPVDIDVAFLTAATASEYEIQLTDAVETIRDRAHAGSTVLATASGLTGVQLAYLLGHLADQADQSAPVTVVGQAATLWTRLGYDLSTVDLVSEFSDPDKVLAPGQITIAGPEVPVAGSAGRLFFHIEDDAGATVVQLTSGAFDPQATAGCTVYDYQVQNHPDEATIDAVVEDLAPTNVVITHQRGPAADQYKDKYASFVWATDDYKEYTLYDGAEWTGPPWVTEKTRRRVRQRQRREPRLGDTVDPAEILLPSVERHDEVDVDAEGLDIERLLKVRQSSDATDADSEAGSSGTDDFEVSTESDACVAIAESTMKSERQTDSESMSEEPIPNQDSHDLQAQLDRIEAAVTGQQASARVIDAGDDVTLLRVTDEQLADELTHGELVSLTVNRTVSTATQDTSKDE